MKLTIKNEELLELNESSTPQFPKYTSQLINLSNQNAQGTRPKVVGQLSELFQEYQKNTDEISIDTWKNGIYQNILKPLKMLQIEYTNRFKI